jgi:hypothetical protein
MFVVVPNENFEEEIRQKRGKNSGEHTPHQQVPVDTLYYYVVEAIGTTSVSLPPFGTPSKIITVNTHYSSDEELLASYRQGEMRKLSSNGTFPPSDDDVVIIRAVDASQVEYRVSAIQSRPWPSRTPRQRGRAAVETISGRLY